MESPDLTNRKLEISRSIHFRRSTRFFTGTVSGQHGMWVTECWGTLDWELGKLMSVRDKGRQAGAGVEWSRRSWIEKWT